jgi:NAD(P)H-dependent FMN reductase
LPGPKPELFFAPDHIRAATQALGADGFNASVAKSWGPFAEVARGWIETTRHRGEAAVRAAYLEVLENRALPEKGYVLSLRE